MKERIKIIAYMDATAYLCDNKRFFIDSDGRISMIIAYSDGRISTKTIGIIVDFDESEFKKAQSKYAGGQFKPDEDDELRSFDKDSEAPNAYEVETEDVDRLIRDVDAFLNEYAQDYGDIPQNENVDGFVEREGQIGDFEQEDEWENDVDRG